VDFFFWCDKGRVFDDDESIFFYLPCPSFGGHPSISYPFASSFTTTVYLIDARRLFLDPPSLSPFSHVGVASPLTHCN